jgi:DNA-binding NarL/FixJ family response regulator
MVREGMAEMLTLNEDIEIVGQVGDGREAVELARVTGAEVVILDVEMPVTGAQAAVRRLLELSSPPKVVIVTVFANQRLVRELLGLRASAFLTKNASSQNLSATVRSVTHVSPGEPDNITITIPREDFDAEEPVESNLSRRELQVLRLAARGMGNKEVANAPTSRRRPSSATCPTSTANSTSTTGARPYARPSRRAGSPPGTSPGTSSPAPLQHGSARSTARYERGW